MAIRAKQAVKKPASQPAAAASSGPVETPSPRPSATAGVDRKRSVSAAVPRAPSSKSPERPAATLERERDELKAALDTALARVRMLEDAQALVANRIGWMIEALQTLRDEGR